MDVGVRRLSSYEVNPVTLPLCTVYRCKEPAAIYVPTGYGALDKMCEPHALKWAEQHRMQFLRMQAFFNLIADLERSA